MEVKGLDIDKTFIDDWESTTAHQTDLKNQ